MIFHPSLDFGIADGYYDLVDGLIGDVYKQASLIPRLAGHTGVPHYQGDLEDMDELSEMRNELMDRVTGQFSLFFISQQSEIVNEKGTGIVITRVRAVVVEWFVLFSSVLCCMYTGRKSAETE